MPTKPAPPRYALTDQSGTDASERFAVEDAGHCLTLYKLEWDGRTGLMSRYPVVHEPYQPGSEYERKLALAALNRDRAVVRYRVEIHEEDAT